MCIYIYACVCVSIDVGGPLTLMGKAPLHFDLLIQVRLIDYFRPVLYTLMMSLLHFNTTLS